MSEEKEVVPRLPEIGEFVRGAGTLRAIEVLPPPPPPPPETQYIFEVISARGEIHRNGKRLIKVSDLSDYYGCHTSVPAAIKEMKAYMAAHDIGSESELEAVVIRESHHRRFVSTGQPPSYGARQFVDFDQLRYGAAANVPPPREFLVWSSRHPELAPLGNP